MSIESWAALIVSICTIVAFAAGSIKWMVKHYLEELKPNSGSSMKDQITRLEQTSKIAEEDRKELHRKIDKMFDVLLDHISKTTK
jgi:ribosome recycling factor